MKYLIAIILVGILVPGCGINGDPKYKTGQDTKVGDVVKTDDGDIGTVTFVPDAGRITIQIGDTLDDVKMEKVYCSKVALMPESLFDTKTKEVAVIATKTAGHPLLSNSVLKAEIKTMKTEMRTMKAGIETLKAEIRTMKAASQSDIIRKTRRPIYPN